MNRGIFGVRMSMNHGWRRRAGISFLKKSAHYVLVLWLSRKGDTGSGMNGDSPTRADQHQQLNHKCFAVLDITVQFFTTGSPTFFTTTVPQHQLLECSNIIQVFRTAHKIIYVPMRSEQLLMSRSVLHRRNLVVISNDTRSARNLLQSHTMMYHLQQ